jgi:hypothetical protein
MGGKKPVNCIPCAKRKVRCDRLQPCCHCKRRLHESCIYPDPNVDNSTTSNKMRIRQLEQHVRSLGGDPAKIDLDSPSEATVAREATEASGKTLGLVAHDEEVTFIETYVSDSFSYAESAS